uniref:Uncharacterized protein n=1 Tax=Anguilla anguilla TaxID=7936 RepID=A0A0E9QVR2_ANGAN
MAENFIKKSSSSRKWVWTDYKCLALCCGGLVKKKRKKRNLFQYCKAKC